MKRINVNGELSDRNLPRVSKFLGDNAFWIYLIVILFGTFLVTNIYFFQRINNYFSDLLHARSIPSKEIIVVEIDDDSIKAIGGWPFDRSLYANAVQKLSNSSPKVVAFDMLMIDETVNDQLVTEVFASAGYSIVLASRASGEVFIKPKISGKNIFYGYTNVPLDPDGKIRRGTINMRLEHECSDSFAYKVFRKYQDNAEYRECVDTVRLRSRDIPDNGFIPLFPKNEFKKISFVNLLDGKFDLSDFHDKIVLIGVTATGVYDSFGDNFVNIEGESVPGVYIFASYINAFLENSFIFYPSYEIFCGLLVIVLLGLVFLTKGRGFLKGSVPWCIFFLGFNVMGVLLFKYGYGWYFVQGTLFILITFSYSMLFNTIRSYVENSFIRKAYSYYLNVDLLKKLMTSKQELNLGGEERVVTVMFNDVREFTSISEEMSPQKLVALINDYLDTMSKIIIKNDGTVDKYIGDCIMAMWNAPILDGKHSLKAVVTAMQMVEALNRFNEDNKYGVELQVGIGIHTGPMVVGNIGSKNRFDYTVIGDNVNIASRVEGLTKKYNVQILVTETVKDCVSHDAIIFRQIDEIMVKGKNKPVKVYEPMFNTRRNVILRRAYLEGFKLYQMGLFKDSVKVFKLLKQDGPAKALIDRIKNNHFPDDWDGVYRWDTK